MQVPRLSVTRPPLSVDHFSQVASGACRSAGRPARALAVTAILLAVTVTATIDGPARAAGPPATRTPSPPHRMVATSRWGPDGLAHGRFQHTRLGAGIVIGPHPDRVTYRDPYGGSGSLAYDRGRWFSPFVAVPFGLTQLVASYDATTPSGTFIEVSARGRTADGRRSSWDSLGRWASSERRFHRMSLGAQRDDLASVSVDTLRAHRGDSFRSWQLRVTLLRRAGSSKTPTVTMAAGMASRLPSGDTPTSRPGPGLPVSLHVQKYSQMIHQGEYPRWNGGGEAWCSPTSTSMVLAYWNRGPTPREYSWVNDSYVQPWVDYAARHTFAKGYDGTGDWPFNTAYAGQFGLDSFVTRLRSLRQAELFVRAGVPLVASVSFGPGQLDNAPITSTSGHLLVIRGFTARGNVVVNDPAAQDANGVRRVYDRGQFENAWLGGSGGLVYVIHPAAVPLPSPAHHANW